MLWIMNSYIFRVLAFVSPRYYYGCCPRTATHGACVVPFSTVVIANNGRSYHEQQQQQQRRTLTTTTTVWALAPGYGSNNKDANTASPPKQNSNINVAASTTTPTVVGQSSSKGSKKKNKKKQAGTVGGAPMASHHRPHDDDNDDDETYPKKTNKRKSKTARKKERKEQSMRDKEHRFKWEQQKKLRRMKNLHPAAQWKRVISACQYWFSDANIVSDDFMRRTLRRHYGWIPVQTLLTFPKFHHWTTAEIVAGALSSPAASKKFKVTYCRDLVERPEQFQHQMRTSSTTTWDDDDDDEMNDEEDEDEKENKARSRQLDDDWGSDDDDDNGEEYRNQVEWESENNLDDFWSDDEKADDVEDDGSSIRSRDRSDTTTKDQDDYTDSDDDDHVIDDADLNEMIASGIDNDEGSEVTKVDHEVFVGNNQPAGMNNEEVYEYDWGDVDDDADELVQDIEHKDGPMDAFSRHNNLTPADVTPDDDDDDEDDQQEQPLMFLQVEADHDDNPQYALVRHTKITLQYLDSLEQVENSDFDSDFDDSDFDSDNDDHDRNTSKASRKKTKKLREKQPATATAKTAAVVTKKKKSSCPRYKSSREVVVVSSPSKLKSFCRSLLASTDAYARNHPPASAAFHRAIGFDVEYCTLEMDIRGNLPAMIQMASPDPQGPVGLIWIDKFPNHGRDIMKDPSCKPLQDIFGDPTLRKVGVRVTGDAINLARWFGTKSAIHMFSGLADLEVGDGGARLSEMSETVLGRRLPKIKEMGVRRKQSRKRKGHRVTTAHWRRTDLTPIMKEYAANDAACAVDIWLKKRQQQQELASTASSSSS